MSQGSPKSWSLKWNGSKNQHKNNIAEANSVSFKKVVRESNPFMNKKIQSQVLQIVDSQKDQESNIFSSQGSQPQSKQFLKGKKSTQCIPIFRKMRSRKKQNCVQLHKLWEGFEAQRKSQLIAMEQPQRFQNKPQLIEEFQSNTARNSRYHSQTNPILLAAERRMLTTGHKTMRNLRIVSDRRATLNFGGRETKSRNLSERKQGAVQGQLTLVISGSRAPSSEMNHPWKRVPTEGFNNFFHIKLAK